MIPCVEHMSLEAVARTMRKYDVHVAMRPWKTLKGTLVHPKDKPDKEDITECVYKVPCANYDKTYIGKLEGNLVLDFNLKTQERM